MKKKLIAALLAGTMTCSLVLAGCAKEASREAGDPGQEEGGGKPAGEGQADEIGRASCRERVCLYL